MQFQLKTQRKIYDLGRYSLLPLHPHTCMYRYRFLQNTLNQYLLFFTLQLALVGFCCLQLLHLNSTADYIQENLKDAVAFPLSSTIKMNLESEEK